MGGVQEESGPITVLAGRVLNNARPDKQLQAFKPKSVVSGCVTNGILGNGLSAYSLSHRRAITVNKAILWDAGQ